jgi:hemerythrin-like domain-containing protein
MFDRSKFTRRRLFGAASVSGLIVAAPALPAFADEQTAAKKAEAKATVTATEDLMREHGVLRRILLIYDAGIRRLGQGEDIDPKLFAQAATLMHDFVHEYHEKAEEEEIFPRFRKAGRLVALVDTLVTQHAAGRKLTDKILEIAPTTRESKDRRKVMTDAMQATIAMYAPHAAREDTDLFPVLHSLVTGAEFDQLGENMEKREKARFGADGFEASVKQIEAIEKRLGIDDLSQFTPKG